MFSGLPDYVPPRQELQRPTAQQINEIAKAAPRVSQGRLMTAAGSLLPIVYGAVRLVGKVIAAREHSGNLVVALGWAHGECAGVQGDIIINGKFYDNVQVPQTHYTGTDSQTPDATLAAAIPGFNDAYKGAAYSVLQIPLSIASSLEAIQRIECNFHGRLIHDARTGLTVFTKNPALFVADWLQNSRFGPGLPVYGAAACADRCDEIVGGVEVRCEAGLCITAAQQLPAMMDLLCLHAECLWSYHEDGVLLVPDAPVEGPAAVLSMSEIRDRTFRADVAGLGSAPTKITGTYNAPSGTADPWETKSEVAQLPGVDEGGTPEIPSTVTYEGTQRGAEAYRKVNSRLKKLQIPGRYSAQLFDAAIRFTKGDVVELPDIEGLGGVWARCMSLELVAPNVWQLTAEHYSADAYPDDMPITNRTTVPVGGVLPFGGSEIPEGWAAYTAPNGRYLVGAGTTVPNGETGGSTAITIAGVTGPGGAHSGGRDGKDTPWTTGKRENSGTGGPENGFGEPDHAHNYSGELTHTPSYLSMPLIEKTGAPGLLPPGAGLLADGLLLSAELQAAMEHVGRLLRAAGGMATGGQTSPRTASVAISPEPDHDHRNGNTGDGATLTFGPTAYKYKPAGRHSHNSTVWTITIEPKRARLAQYVATRLTEIVPGGMIFWPSSETPPAGWYACDGNNGTLDLDGCYIELSAPGSAGVVVGNNTASWGGRTATAPPHNHKGESMYHLTVRRMPHETDDFGHAHDKSGSVEFRPPYCALKIIQYTGVEE